MTRRRPRSRTVDLTSPDRLLFPDDGITKADLAAYHAAMAEVMVPHLAGRPLMLQRFPEGITADGFYQKDAGSGMPEWLRTVRVPKKGGVVDHPVVDGAAALLALTNLSTISFHRWTSRADRLDRPDLLVIDVDPSTDDFDDVQRGARWTADLLDTLGLVPYVQTTGSRGVHVIAPATWARTAGTTCSAKRAAGPRPRPIARTCRTHGRLPGR